MRKFLNQNFWSHGTPIGSLGPLYQKALILGFDQHQIPVIWGPYDPSEVTPLQTQEKFQKQLELGVFYSDNQRDLSF